MFQLLRSVLGSSDFWIMCFLNLMFALVVNGVLDYFVILNKWSTPPRVFKAAERDTYFVFFLINAFLAGGNRQRQVNLIKEGAIKAVPSSAYSDILTRVLFFGVTSTKSALRAILIAINALVYVATTYFAVREIMTENGVWNKYTIFSGVRNYGPCISCAIFTEMIWKGYIFVVLYFLTYASSLNEGQPELSAATKIE